jgi:hypothetical protein
MRGVPSLLILQLNHCAEQYRSAPKADKLIQLENQFLIPISLLLTYFSYLSPFSSHSRRVGVA